MQNDRRITRGRLTIAVGILLLILGLGYSLNRPQTAALSNQIFPKNELTRYSREYGYQLWEDLKKHPIHFSLEDIVIGMNLNAEGKILPDDETTDEFLQRFATLRKMSLEEQAKKNRKRSEEYLAIIAKKAGIIALEDEKLYYEIQVPGREEPFVESNSSYYFHYTIKTIDNEEIVDTRKENTPKQVNLATALPAFSKGVVNMKKGERRIIYAHPDLAYGTHRQIVPPQMIVIIDVETI